MLVGRRRLDVRQDRLLQVADVVAVGVCVRETREPRELVEVVDGVRLVVLVGLEADVVGALVERAVVHRVAVHPVVPERGRRVRRFVGLIPRPEDDVARPCLVGGTRQTEERVEAVEELVEVVHAVAVRVGLARVARDVAVRVVVVVRVGGVREKRRVARARCLPLPRLRRQGIRPAVVALAQVIAEVVIHAVLEHVERVVDRRGRLPRNVAVGEVGAQVEEPVGEAGVILARAVGRAVVGDEGAVRLVLVEPTLDKDVAPPVVAILIVLDIFARHLVRDPGRGDVVVAPAAHRADHVFLPVEEAVVVVVLEGVGFRRVHAVAVRPRARRDLVRRRRAALVRRDHRHSSRVRNRRVELQFPRIGKAVVVGVPRERVEAAAIHAVLEEGIGVLRRAEDPRHGRAVPQRAGVFLAVREAVAVGVGVPRIGRPNLVLPLRVDVHNRLARRIFCTALDAAELAVEAKAVFIGIRV